MNTSRMALSVGGSRSKEPELCAISRRAARSRGGRHVEPKDARQDVDAEAVAGRQLLAIDLRRGGRGGSRLVDREDEAAARHRRGRGDAEPLEVGLVERAP